jgi:hypothetical protein
MSERLSHRSRNGGADKTAQAAPLRRWLRRVALSALAGGGLTGIGLTWPLVGGAVPADAAGTAFAGGPTIGPPASGSGAPTSSTVTTSSAAESSTDSAEATTSTGSAEATSSVTPTVTATSQTTASGGSAGHRANPPGSHVTATVPQVFAEEGQGVTGGSGAPASSGNGGTPSAGAQSGGAASGPTNVPSNVVGAPQMVAAEAGALAALTSGLNVSAQALDLFYQVPPFLLPIYQSAAIQYGVPWEILAAINEVETDYGNDLNVSSAGAVGWMQFMPETWLQYGVDALDAGYADPYNPVDAIFAAARYLAAAGAAKDVRGAIFSYNHSEEYVESVLLRARLLASYPPSVIATLTGLAEGTPPVRGARVVTASVDTSAFSTQTSSATANAVTVPTPADAAKAAGVAHTAAHKARPPKHISPLPSPTQFVQLEGESRAPVVAAQDGRVVALGHSRKLGDYVAIEDVYGDVFSYAGLANLASLYRLPADASGETGAGVPTATAAASETANGTTPTQPATAGSQPPLTLHASGSSQTQPSELAPVTGEEFDSVSSTVGKVVMFARPDNPEARIAAVRLKSLASSGKYPRGWAPLRVGAVVSQGATLGTLTGSGNGHTGYMRFAIRPAGDASAVDPQPILQNWSQLQHALHPKGAAASSGLVGATAADVFLMSQAELERAVLADPNVELPACGRHEVAAGHVDSRVLAALLFLSRNGLSPKVSDIRCAAQPYAARAAHVSLAAGDAVDISAVNGVPIAGHQGAGSITDLTIRTLLTLQGRFAPRTIDSLMRYPAAPSTRADLLHAGKIGITFAPSAASVRKSAATVSSAAHSAGPGATAPSPFLVGSSLSSTGATPALSSGEWNQLLSRIGALQQPKVPTKPTSSAVRDPKSTRR